MNRVFLILGGAALAVFAFVLGQFSPLIRTAEPEIVYVEVEPSLVSERRIGFSCDYDIGDLIPCDPSSAQYELALSVFVGERRVHSWNVHFTTFDGSNNDSRTDSALRSGYFSVSGNPGFSGTSKLVELTGTSVRAKIEWLCTLDSQSYRFKFPVVFALGTNGTLELGEEKRVSWEFVDRGEANETERK